MSRTIYTIRMITAHLSSDHKVNAATPEDAAQTLTDLPIRFAGMFDDQTWVYIDSLSTLYFVESRP